MKRYRYPVEIYCDGACSGKSGKAGWAAIIRFINYKGEVHVEEVVTGNSKNSTNNRAELRAILDPIVHLNREGWRGLKITVYTDNQNAISWITGQMRRNDRYIQKYTDKINWEIKKGKHVVRFEKVKSNSGHKLNERTSNIAEMAIKWLKYKDEYVY